MYSIIERGENIEDLHWSDWSFDYNHKQQDKEEGKKIEDN
jgi:hypothetical protein